MLCDPLNILCCDVAIYIICTLDMVYIYLLVPYFIYKLLYSGYMSFLKYLPVTYLSSSVLCSITLFFSLSNNLVLSSLIN